MAAAFRLFYFCIVFIVYCFSLASAQDDNQFIFNGFTRDDELHLFGAAYVHQNGLLQLTNSSRETGQALCRSPIKFNTSSYESLSFSTNFVFAMVPAARNFGGNGMALFFSPSLEFPKFSIGSYLGIFNMSTNGEPTNHILAIELDTVESPEYEDINGNHVGIDVYSLTSKDSAPAAYFSDEERKNKSVELESGNPIHMWIDYNGAEMLLNVTVAPIGIPKPSRPLLSTSINLSQILLEAMYVGFSAATGTLLSDHYILGWSFNKTGQAQNLDIKNLPSLPKRGDNTKPSLTFIVLIVAAVIVLITIVAAVYFVRKKKYEEIYEDWEREYGPQRFSYSEVAEEETLERILQAN